MVFPQLPAAPRVRLPSLSLSTSVSRSSKSSPNSNQRLRALISPRNSRYSSQLRHSRRLSVACWRTLSRWAHSSGHASPALISWRSAWRWLRSDITLLLQHSRDRQDRIKILDIECLHDAFHEVVASFEHAQYQRHQRLHLHAHLSHADDLLVVLSYQAHDRYERLLLDLSIDRRGRSGQLDPYAISNEIVRQVERTLHPFAVLALHEIRHLPWSELGVQHQHHLPDLPKRISDVTDVQIEPPVALLDDCQRASGCCPSSKYRRLTAQLIISDTRATLGVR